MASVKCTFTLDLETVARLNEMAARLRRSKSAIVRDAIQDFSERVDRLSEGERRRMLAAIDELAPKIPQRPIDEVEDELEGIRNARRQGGRGGSPAKRT